MASLTLPGGQQISYSLADAIGVDARVKGSKAVYGEILPETDIELEPFNTGLKETIVLQSAGAPTSFVFPLTLNGLTPSLGEDGSVLLTDAAGAVAARIPPGVMWDSRFDPETGEMTTSSGVAYELVEVDGGPALRVSVDEEWVRHPDRQFPIRVDPTVTTMASPTMDAFVDNDSTTAPGHQNGVDLTVATYDNGAHIARSFIYFGNFNNTGFAGWRVTGATLRTYLSWTYDCNHTQTMQVFRVTSPWTDTGLSTQGLWGPSLGAFMGQNRPADNYPACLNQAANRSVGDWFDVGLDPATLNDWSANPSTNLGLGLKGYVESGSDEWGVESKYYWKRLTSSNYSSGEYGPRLWLTYEQPVPPQVNAQYPPSGYTPTSLTPELLAEAVDPDAFPNPVKYDFRVYEPGNSTALASSGSISASSWRVPAGTLAWGKSYLWTVIATDGAAASSSQTMNVLRTPPPQPLVTSGLADNGGHGFAPGAGNFTTTATDAQVATVGPPLSVVRSYNSRDPRVASAFGAGWSSLVDMAVTERTDTQGTVLATITYPTGQDVTFARNANGTFATPPGRFATLTKQGSTGYQLVDKDGTTYVFAGASGRFTVTSVSDAAGRRLNLTANASGQVETITSASGRALRLTWDTPAGATRPHVTAVTTNEATSGDPDTAAMWTYGYNGDQLTSACVRPLPTDLPACTNYTYTDATLHPSTVLNAGPRSYWRLGEASGTVARSDVVDNGGTDTATYANVMLGQPGPLPGSSAKAAAFDGTSSSVTLPKNLLTSKTYQSVSLWFKTTTPGGVLLSEGNAPLGSSSQGHAVWPLYVGMDGKLHGAWYTGTTVQQVSTQTVTDGAWHHAVLTAAGGQQWLYLDGTPVSSSSLSGQVQHLDMAHTLLGVGYSSAQWPSQPAQGWRYFNGSIAEVALFDRDLTAAEVTLMRETGTRVAHPMTSVLRPSGNPQARVSYNAATGTVTQVTDANGLVWELPDPVVAGSYQVHSAAVLGASPSEYWRLAEAGVAEAISQVHGGQAPYSGVTLGVAGGPFDDPAVTGDETTVASFNGTSSFLALPSADVPSTQPMSIAMWFKLNAGQSGVLFGYQIGPLSTASGGWVPAMYVDTSGKLRAKLHTSVGNVSDQMISGASVADGKWHHVVLAASSNTQSLYLDGTAIGTISATRTGFGESGAQIGAGKWSSWPGTSGTIGYWPGQIAEVSMYRHQLSAEQVDAQFGARAASTGGLVRTVTVANPATPTDPARQIKSVFDVSTGRKVADIDALGKKTQFGYDVGGYRRSVVDANGHVTISQQDKRGNTIATTTCQDQFAQACSTVYFGYYPDAETTELTPNPLNDVLLWSRDGRSSSAADNTYKTTYAYDAAGNLTSVTDPIGRITLTEYTTATTPAFGGGVTPPGLPTKSRTPGGAVSTLEYYPNGDVARITDPAGLVTTFTYDGLGRVKTQTQIPTSFPSGLITTYTYDLLGRPITQTDPLVTNRVTGAEHIAVTTTEYNVDGFLVSKTVSDTKGGDASRTESWDYNEHGQQRSATDAEGKTILMEYDAYGRLWRETSPNGRIVETNYDANGKLLSSTLVNWEGSPNDPSPPGPKVLLTKGYDPAGRLAFEVDERGFKTTYTYTDNNLVRQVARINPSSGTPFVLESNSYNAAGHLIGQVTNNGTTTTTFGVDNAGRTISSTLDPGGAGHLARVTSQVLSPDDQVLSQTVSDAGGVRSRADTIYDPAGRVLATATPTTTAAPVPYGRWRLDETTGTVAADSTGNSPVTAGGSGISWSTERGGSVALDRTPLDASGPVIDTSRSYTVAAWVKREDAGNANTTAVSASGNVVSAFYLGFATSGKWQFSLPSDDATGGGSSWYNTQSTADSQTGVWTHLVGVYDQQAAQIRLYVNGVHQASTPISPRWRATGIMRIGMAKWNSYNLADGWVGGIDDVQVYQDALSTSQISTIFDGAALAPGASVVRESWTLDSTGAPLSTTDPNGNTTDYDLDEAGRVTAVIDPAVLTESAGGTAMLTRPITYTGYDTFGEIVETQDPSGEVTTTLHDARGLPTSTTLPSYTPPGSSTSVTPVTHYGYDDVGQLTSRTDPLGITTTYTYDQLGRLASTSAPDAGVTKYSYLDAPYTDQRTVIDPTGAVSRADYDYLGRVTDTYQVVRQAGATYRTRYAYGTHGWLTSTTTHEGVVTSTTYNAAGEPISETDGANTTATYQYDGLGRRVRATLPNNSYTSSTYDAADRRLALASFTAGNTPLTTSTTEYDRAGNVVASTDPRGARSTFAYDAAGRLVSQTQPINASDSITTSFGYDVAGRQTRFTDGRGNAFLTTYNDWGLPEDYIEPPTPVHPNLADRTFTMVYNEAGRAVEQRSPGGVNITFSYDDAGRVTGQSGTGAEAATVARTFGYDDAGRLTSASGPGGGNTFGYDDRGLLTTAEGGSGTSTFVYNGDGRATSRVDAAGTTNYSYDTAGRLRTLSNPTSGIAAGYTYNELSQIATITYGSSGNKRWLGYDPHHRLASDELKTPGGAPISKITYDYDLNGNETSKTTAGFSGTINNTYTYDLANRLASWDDHSTTPTVYAYDKSGNRLQAGTTLFTYDERNRLKTSTDGPDTTLYSYTARGTLSDSTVLGVSTAETQADAFGQITSQDTGTGPAHTYEYDALGRSLLPGSAYTGLGNDLATDGTTTYARDPAGGLVGAKMGSTERYLWTDQHTDVVGQFTPTGTALNGSTTYDPFGKVLATGGTIGSLGYQSEYTDTGTGRVNMHARWYNPETGAFDTRDSVSLSPVGSSVRANRYSYADANPLTITDPTGHWPNPFKAVANEVTSVAKTVKNTVKAVATTVYNTAKSVASGVVNTARRVATTIYNTAKAVVTTVVNTVRNVASTIYNTVRTVASNVYNAAQQAAQWVDDRVDQATHWVAEQIDHAKEIVINGVNVAIDAGRTALAEAARVAQEVVHTVADAYESVEKWVVEHKADIAGFAVGLVVGAGCGALIGWTGVGAVACGVVAGAAGSFVTGLMEGQSGWDLVKTAAFGAGMGLAFGPLGGKVLGALARTGIGSRVVSAVSNSFIGKAAGAIGNGINRATTAIGNGISRATQGLGNAVRNGVNRVANLFRSGCTRPGHSFLPSTPVLMADGSTKPIEDITIGDSVTATDPENGTTAAKPVTALHLNRDTELTDITVTVDERAAATGTGPSGAVKLATAAIAASLASTAVLHTTENHPFWDETTDTWVAAADLTPGHELRTDTGDIATVTAVANFSGSELMRDLTVADIHTYYVLAGDTPVLVHNNDVPCTTTIYRVQTDHPGSQRLSVDDGGNVGIHGDGMLHLNMSGDIGHSLQFRGGQGQIVAFDVPTAFVDRIRGMAVPQRRPPGMTRQDHRGRPQIDDPTVGPDLFGIPTSMLSELQSVIIPGSGRAVRPG